MCMCDVCRLSFLGQACISYSKVSWSTTTWGMPQTPQTVVILAHNWCNLSCNIRRGNLEFQNTQARKPKQEILKHKTVFYNPSQFFKTRIWISLKHWSKCFKTQISKTQTSDSKHKAAKPKPAKPKPAILNTKQQNPNQQNPKEKF